MLNTTKPNSQQFKQNKLAPYSTDGRLFATDVCAKFNVTRHKLGQI